MRSLQYDYNGEPWDVLRLVDAASPTVGPGGVLVAVEAAPVHIADLKAIRGDLAFIPHGPGVPGFEGVGRVVACGAAVTGWAIGDRVILPLAYGSWSEIVAAKAEELWRAPASAPAEQLALVRVNLTTAYLLLHAYLDLKEGDWIIQNAANSNVAGYVRQLARPLGLKVIDVVRRPELVAPLSELGLSQVMVDSEDLADRVAAIAAPPSRLALDAIGGAATARLGRCVADGGLVLAYGFLAEQAYSLDFPDVMFRNVRLSGMMTDRAAASIGEAGREKMKVCLEILMGSATLSAQIAGIYAFQDAAAAMRHAAETGSGRAGKVILVP